MINSTNEIFTTVIKKKNFQEGFTFELTLFNGITEIFFFIRDRCHQSNFDHKSRYYRVYSNSLESTISQYPGTPQKNGAHDLNF